MLTSRKLLLLFLIFTTCLIGSILIYRFEFLKKSESLLTNRFEQEKRELKHAIAVPQKKLDSYLYDYTFWDDMADFVANPDTAWAKINIDNSMKTFHLYAEWILNEKSELVYYTSIEKNDSIKKDFLTNEIFSTLKISANKNQAHFYACVRGKVFEIIEGTIQHGDDTTRTENNAGYLYAATLIDSSYINYINDLTGDSLVVKSYDANVDSFSNLNDRFMFVQPGFDINHTPAILFQETVFIPTFHAMQVSNKNLLILFSVCWILVLIIAIFIVSSWITKPLFLITKALQNEEDKSIEPMLHWKSEFGTISMLVKKFMAQKKELIESKNIAIAENKAKTDFLSLVSHELRTPLQSIIGLSDIMERSQLNSVQSDQIKSIRVNGDLLLSVINDVLDFAKLNAGEFELMNEEIELVKLMDELIDIFSVAASAKKLGLYYFYEGNVPSSIKCDSFRIRQVLVNLINNAIKFTEEGVVTVHISVNEVRIGHPELIFSVTDTGTGISEEDQRKIFRPFIQADNFSNRKKGGTGLGLAISMRIVEYMNGKIWLESLSGHGTTFYFTVPLVSNSGTIAKQLPIKDPEQQKVFLWVQEKLLQENILKLFDLWKPPFEVVEHATGLINQISASEKNSPILIFEQRSILETEELAKTLTTKFPSKNIHLFILSSTKINELFKLEESGVINGFLNLPFKHLEFFQKLSEILSERVGIKTKYFSHRIDEENFKQATTTMKVLVVEDNKINQQILRLFLQRTGAEMAFVESGKEAIDKLRQEKFNLVLMDLSMPEMDGITAAKLIIADEQIPEKPVIVALTAHAFDEDKQKCFEAGMQDFMTKPLSLEAFNKLISKWDSIILAPKKPKE